MYFSGHKNKNFKSKKSGFTLIELLVVISIIGLLSSVVLASVNTARDRANIAAGQQFAGYLDRNFGADGILMMDFNETAGNATDWSGNNLTGVFGSGVSRVPSMSGLGTAINLSGTGDVDINNSQQPRLDDGTNKLIMSAWIRPTALTLGTYPMIVTNSDGSSPEILELRIANGTGQIGTLEGLISNDTAFYSASSQAGSIKINVWQHVAMSYNGSRLTIYLNGKEVGSTNVAINIKHGNDWRIGNRYSPTPLYFTGQIDNVRVIKNSIN